jgi:hypothetical protein
VPEPALLLDDILRRCTVRIDRKNAPAGSGFFVAPGRVVTCAHVIQPHGSTSSVAAADLSIHDYDLKVHVVEAVFRLWPDEDPDLAILTVRAGTDHPSVLLDAERILTGDALRTYGYPIDDATGRLLYDLGLPTTIEAEGELGGTHWIRLKQGQVQPGMSGSPILNDRTGGVAGILKRTRDASQALGGYAVPVASLLQRVPLLTEENDRVHLADPFWLDVIQLTQREAWWATRGGATTVVGTPARQLVVTVGPGGNGAWEVRARLDGNATPIGGGSVDLNAVRGAVARLFRAWSARGRIPEAEQIRTLGQVLFSAAFPGGVGSALNELLDGPEERIMISLNFESAIPEDFVNLPWEHLYAAVRGARDEVLLATDRRLGLVRTLGEEPMPSTNAPERSRLSILVVAATSSATDDEDDAEPVGQALRRLLALGDQIPALDIEVIRAPRAQALAERVEKQKPDVVHYLGFGAYVDGIDRLMLGGRGPGGLDAVTVTTFKQSMMAHPPELAVLQLCQSPAGTVPADFAMLGPSLLRVPIPAVVAVQYPLPPGSATKFCDTFYRALTDGKPIDRAVQEGRMKLAFDIDELPGFLYPALFLLAPGERRLMRGGAARSRPPLTPARPGPQQVFA